MHWQIVQQGKQQLGRRRGSLAPEAADPRLITAAAAAAGVAKLPPRRLLLRRLPGVLRQLLPRMTQQLTCADRAQAAAGGAAASAEATRRCHHCGARQRAAAAAGEQHYCPPALLHRSYGDPDALATTTPQRGCQNAMCVGKGGCQRALHLSRDVYRLHSCWWADVAAC